MILVYCSKCGAKNKDDAKICAKCGESIYPPVGKVIERRAETCFGPRKRREPHVEECFGVPRGGAIFGILLGAVIIIVGLLYVMGQFFGWTIDVWETLWPLVLVIIGVLILAGAVYGLSRRR